VYSLHGRCGKGRERGEIALSNNYPLFSPFQHLPPRLMSLRLEKCFKRYISVSNFKTRVLASQSLRLTILYPFYRTCLCTVNYENPRSVKGVTSKHCSRLASSPEIDICYAPGLDKSALPMSLFIRQ